VSQAPRLPHKVSVDATSATPAVQWTMASQQPSGPPEAAHWRQCDATKPHACHAKDHGITATKRATKAPAP